MERSSNIKIITEQSKSIPVLGEWDLIVVGAGLSGVAGAIAAARLGLSVCIIEKQYSPGGLATLGNVTMWLPLCNGKGIQVTSGLAEELLKLSVKDISDTPLPEAKKESFANAGIRPIPDCWKPNGDLEIRAHTRYEVDFNPSSYLIALEKLLLDNHVDIMYDTRVCGVVKNNKKQSLIDFLIIENKSGRMAAGSKVFIDATGDADIAYFTGEDTTFCNANVPASWAYTWGSNGFKRRLFSNPYSPLATRDSYEGPFFRGDIAEDVTAQLIASRRILREKLEDIRRKERDPNMQVFLPPAMPDLRMTRRINGRKIMKNEHMYQWLEDTIGLVGDWRKPGPVYPISFGSICCRKTDNLLVVGRCMSADNDIWDVLRVFPPCAVTGEAAGTAAAIAVSEDKRDASNVEIVKLQNQLKAQGVLLDAGLLDH